MTVLDELRGVFVDPEIAAAIDAAPNRVNEFGFDAWGFSRMGGVATSISRGTYASRYSRAELESTGVGATMAWPGPSGARVVW